jgi:uncharacterized protein YjbI with pentapeptide repeats
MILKNLKICIKEAFEVSFAGFSFTNCDMSNSDFAMSDLQGVQFINCNLTNTNFYAANLTQTDFKNSTLVNASFEEAHLQFTNFQNSDLRHARILNETLLYTCIWDGANIMNASFSNENFVSDALNGKLPVLGLPFLDNEDMGFSDGYTFANLNLYESSFRNCFFSNTSFQNSNVRGSDFKYTSLENVDFQGADLCGAHFEGADFKNVNFVGAIYDNTTKGIPDNFKSNMVLKA